MAEHRLEILLDELLSGRISPEDAAAFVAYVDDPGGRAELEGLLEARFDNDQYQVMPGLVRQAGVKARLMEKLETLPQPVSLRRRMLPWMRWTAAAAVLLVLAGGWWWMGQRKATGKNEAAANKFLNDVQPGTDKAVLQLADGSHIMLTDAGDGDLVEQENARVIRKKGALVYEAGKKAAGIYYNMVSTPAAGKYHVVLTDGTEVWLDALSSIRYPTAFGTGARVVEVTGQAYLQVAKRPGQPFLVKLRDETVEVLGTSFNINAYDNEPSLRTTLVDGAVKVISNDKSLVLKPGEEARLEEGAGLQLVKGPDMDATLAWKNGLFTYNGASIETIMREVSRWYGVEVVYGDKIKEQFVADIPRDVPLTKLLTLLSGTRQVHFSVENKKVTVVR